MTGGLRQGGAARQDLLAEIVASVRRDLAAKRERQPREQLVRVAHDLAPRGSLFVEALARPGRINVIAECKRRSPTGGTLCQDYRPGRIAQGYRTAGAAAVSVLTEPRYFGGTIGDLREVTSAVDLPVLRKDFIIDEYQLVESRAAGADAVLLIAAALEGAQLRDLIVRARKLDLAAVVEAHDASDVERAIEAGATIIGVNSRDLRTLTVDLQTSATLIRSIPAGIVAVAESGIDSPESLAHLRECGYHAFLIGGHLMSSPDPGGALADLLQGVTPSCGQLRGESRCG